MKIFYYPKYKRKKNLKVKGVPELGTMVIGLSLKLRLVFRSTVAVYGQTYLLPHLPKRRVFLRNEIKRRRHGPNLVHVLRYDVVGNRQICPELNIFLPCSTVSCSRPRNIIHRTDPDHPSYFRQDNL